MINHFIVKEEKLLKKNKKSPVRSKLQAFTGTWMTENADRCDVCFCHCYPGPRNSCQTWLWAMPCKNYKYFRGLKKVTACLRGLLSGAGKAWMETG